MASPGQRPLGDLDRAARAAVDGLNLFEDRPGRGELVEGRRQQSRALALELVVVAPEPLGLDLQPAQMMAELLEGSVGIVEPSVPAEEVDSGHVGQAEMASQEIADQVGDEAADVRVRYGSGRQSRHDWFGIAHLRPQDRWTVGVLAGDAAGRALIMYERARGRPVSLRRWVAPVMR